MPPPPPVPADPAGALVGQHDAAGLAIGPDTAHPLWAGERLDLGYAIEVLRPR